MNINNTNESDELFNDFINVFGQMMTHGLNQLEPDRQKIVVDAYRNGSTMFAVCTGDPPTFAAMIEHDGHNVELFRVTEHGEKITH